MRFKKKPVEVDAVQWKNFLDTPDHDVKVFGTKFENEKDEAAGCEECMHPASEHGWIKSSEGGYIVCPGDWIITSNDLRFPCKPDIFDKTYDPLEPVSKCEQRFRLQEDLSDCAHHAWSGWMQYIFEKSEYSEEGTVTIPKWAVERWERQFSTKYKDLPEDEKKSDRAEAHKMLNVMRKHGISLNKPMLGLATCKELLDELSARIEVHGPGLEYKTVGGEEITNEPDRHFIHDLHDPTIPTLPPDDLTEGYDPNSPNPGEEE